MSIHFQLVFVGSVMLPLSSTPPSSTSSDLQLIIVGGAIGIVGAILGGVAGAAIGYWLEERRDRRHQREQYRTMALEWANEGRVKNLRHIDLRKADLTGVDLSCSQDKQRGADLSHSNLRKANLSHALLAKTDFQRVNLRKANLTEADLSEADLQDADLRGAILTGTNFSGALLVRAKLGQTNLNEAIIEHANLSEANLQDASITKDQLKKAETFDKAILPTENIYK